MAQVMYYHKWPVTATKTNPGYTDYYGTKRLIGCHDIRLGQYVAFLLFQCMSTDTQELELLPR